MFITDLGNFHSFIQFVMLREYLCIAVLDELVDEIETRMCTKSRPRLLRSSSFHIALIVRVTMPVIDPILRST